MTTNRLSLEIQKHLTTIPQHIPNGIEPEIAAVLIPQIALHMVLSRNLNLPEFH